MLLVSLLSACAQTKHVMASMGRSSEPSDDAVVLGAPDAEQYLRELQDFAIGDPRSKQRYLCRRTVESTLTPGPQTNLRYALILATPGHTGFDPEMAQTMLRERAAAGIHSDGVRGLAGDHPPQVCGTTDRTQFRGSACHGYELTRCNEEEEANRQRLAAVEAENRRLRKNSPTQKRSWKPSRRSNARSASKINSPVSCRPRQITLTLLHGRK